MSRLGKLLVKAPGLFRTLAAVFGSAAVIVPEVTPIILADGSLLAKLSGIIGAIGLIRAGARKVVEE